MKNITIEYDGMTFVFHPNQTNEGFYFVHQLSSHGFYNFAAENVLGKPTLKNSLEKLIEFINSNPTRKEIIYQYKERFNG